MQQLHFNLVGTNSVQVQTVHSQLIIINTCFMKVAVLAQKDAWNVKLL